MFFILTNEAENDRTKIVWFWFHSAVQHEPWVLIMCLFGLVKEVRRCTKKTTGSNTSYIPSLLGNQDKMKTTNAKAEVQDGDIYEHTDRGASRISFLSELTYINIKAFW